MNHLPDDGASPAVLILPGIPGVDEDVATERYPSHAADFVRLLKEQQVAVVWAEPADQRETLVFRSVDTVWFPTALFFAAYLDPRTLAALTIAIDTYKTLFERSPRTKAIARFGVIRPDGSQVWFEGEAESGAAVAKMIRAARQPITDRSKRSQSRRRT